MSIIKKLSSGRIFDIDRLADQKGFLIRETCDDYFKVTLSKEELIQLGEEIIQMATSNSPGLSQ